MADGGNAFVMRYAVMESSIGGTSARSLVHLRGHTTGSIMISCKHGQCGNAGESACS